MGLFDTLSFESAAKFLLDVDWNGNPVPHAVAKTMGEHNNFQTKDLDNTLSHFLVSVDGQLKSQHFEDYEYESDLTGTVINGAIKYSGEHWISEQFTGVIEIYDQVDFLNQDWHVTFTVAFHDGVLKKIECSDIEVVSNLLRKKEEIARLNHEAKRLKIMENPLARWYAGFWVYPLTKFFFVKSCNYPRFKKLFKILADILIPFKGNF